ncbi:SixA phosphatase family protein [Filimonas effusa]|uniref:Histidine phosphatase family protein n=1 Tax=Filimonas effusa TaxID=2508721 RepID=A0A4Q1D524_9BACT|nr:histidine phosphatase family protein [Filimonas effusa]RXK83580.1 histidine phosphatase family protein [Filimonas effusa]
MKKLILIRHAKSSWSSGVETDFDRPLNDRGVRDAPVMAMRLKERLPQVDAIVSSAAKRTMTTAGYFAEAYGLKSAAIVREPRLYHAPPQTFDELIVQLDDQLQTVIMCAHNPGITEFVNGLTQVRLDNMPTCAVFAVEVATERWQDFKTAAKSFLFFDYPKNVL